ncbi:MAG: HAD family hydrolase, partial [Chloroflexi bacterium]
TAEQSLREALRKIGAPDTAEALLTPAIKIYFAPEEEKWVRYPDTEDTLKRLSAQGYRMGLYSNATDDPFIQRLVNTRKLRPWLSPTFCSAQWGWRKPKPEPFLLIAQRWGLSPDEVVVVGDTLNADILGAQNAGMHSILVTMDEAPSNEDNRHIRPSAVAGSLAELPDLLAELSSQ